MTRHLGDRDFATILAGEALDATAAEHLESCVSCRREAEQLSELVAARRHELLGGSPDWDRQRDQVLARIPSAPRAPKRRRWLAPLLAAAAVLMLAFGLRQTWLPQGPAELQSQSDFEAEEVLAEVDELLADDSLPGFEPIDPGFDVAEAYFSNGSS
jgi:hypothetical protein